MKEMVYSATRAREILHSGIYNGRKFYILSLGTHPTAYVSLKENEPWEYGNPYYDVIEVHFGFTYCGKAVWAEDDTDTYIGWDYAHYCDYCGYFDFDNTTKKWTTAEILKEVESVINQLNKSIGGKTNGN